MIDTAFDTMEEHNGQWRPSIPLPLYTWSWFATRKRYVCKCKLVFKYEVEYERHYIEQHLPPSAKRYYPDKYLQYGWLE